MKLFKIFTLLGCNGNYVNFHQAILPVYWLSRIFGFIPFTITIDTKNNCEKLFVSNLDVCRYGIALAVHIFSGYWKLTQTFSVNYNSTIAVHANGLVVICTMCSTLLTLLMEMLNRRRIGYIVKEINEIDEVVK